MVFNHLLYRADTVFWISQESQQQFGAAVSPASAQPGKGRIHPVDSPDNSFNSVGKRQLLVVVSVDSDSYHDLGFKKEGEGLYWIVGEPCFSG